MQRDVVDFGLSLQNVRSVGALVVAFEDGSVVQIPGFVRDRVLLVCEV